ncbi:hypothetical protein D9M70_476200 [compost metagenome]
MQEVLDLRTPGVAVQGIGVLGREGRQSRLAEEVVEVRAGRAAARDVTRVLFRRGAQARRWEGDGLRWRGGVEFFQAEDFEQHHLLAEGLGAEERARHAVGGVVEGSLPRRRQHVVDPGGVAVAGHAVGQLDGAGIGRGGQLQCFQRRLGVFRGTGEVRGVVHGRRPEEVQRNGDRGVEIQRQQRTDEET